MYSDELSFLVNSVYATYRRMVIGKSVVDSHILEEPPNVVIEKAFDFTIIIFRVDEDSSDVRFDNIRKALACFSHTTSEGAIFLTFGGFLVIVQ